MTTEMLDETTEAWLSQGSGNIVLERLKNKLPVLALGVRASRTGDIARMALATGHHAIWVDLEHSSISIDCCVAICATALDIGVFPFVRIPEREYGVIGRLLDGGALGIIAPRIETVEQAVELAQAVRFPPLGHRSAIATTAHLRFRRLPAARMQAESNRATLLKILLESPRGIANAEAIARVPGVDLIGIGTNDLSAELGVPGDFKHPKVLEAHDRALEACARAGKPIAIGGVSDLAYSAELIARGAAPFLMTGIDSDMMLSALEERAAKALASLVGPRHTT